MNNKLHLSVAAPVIAMPGWLEKIEAEYINMPMISTEEKLRFVINLAKLNVQNQTGGPFGAAIFDESDHKLLAAGVNLVVVSGQSYAHAEMLAISNGQYRYNKLKLNGCILVASCEPCVMCYGGILWSGVNGLIYGAPGSEAAKIGFDEGDKVENWQDSLIARGISVEGPRLTAEAASPFELYAKSAGRIY